MVRKLEILPLILSGTISWMMVLFVVTKILAKQLDKYKEARDWNFINVVQQSDNEDIYVDNARKFYWLKGEAYFAFSKHKDKPLKQVVEQEPEFCQWIIDSDFSEETKSIVRQAMNNGKKK